MRPHLIDNHVRFRGVSHGVCHAIGVCVSLVFSAFADLNAPAAFNDGIDRSDPSFVTASLLVMSPGSELYSCAGHSCIRLECPKFNLDFCFSYESEPVKEKVFTFFRGNLKMGMFAVPTAEYLKAGRQEGRGVMQYRLDLPPDVEQRLWKILDERAAQGVNLPYDYVKRGCGRSVRVVLEEALHPLRMELPPFPEKYKKTPRELWDAAVAGHPWNRFFLHSFCGTEHDRNLPDIEKVVVPGDLVEFLRMAKLNGKPIVAGEGVALLHPKDASEPTALNGFTTPLAVACAIVAMAAANWLLKMNWLDWLFLALQSLAGAFFTYLVAFSNLPATGWNWLVVPFNLMPLVFWKWRRKWALWFAGVLMLWEAGMFFWPHRLTDPTYLVLVGAYVLMYVRTGWSTVWSRVPRDLIKKTI